MKNRRPSPEFLSEVSDLMTSTRAFVNEIGLYPRRQVPAENVLPALLSKSIVVTESVVCLVANGFEDEAYGLCRTNVEIMLIIRHLTNKNVSERVDRYTEYFAKDHERLGKLVEKYYPDMDVALREDESWWIETAAKYKSYNRWAEKELKEFAFEPDSFTRREDGSSLTDDFYYEVVYRLMSQFVHGTVISLQPAHLIEYGDPFVVHNGAGRSSRGSDALRTATLTVWLNLMRVLRYLDIKATQSISDHYDRVIDDHIKHVSE